MTRQDVCPQQAEASMKLRNELVEHEYMHFTNTKKTKKTRSSLAAITAHLQGASRP